MRGNATIIELLNDVLSAELTAISQYFLHARMCQNWGYERLWKKIRAESVDEMKHADMIIERILFLEGSPNVANLGKITIGKTVKQQLQLDLALEHTAIPRLNRAIESCRAAEDNGTRALLEGILRSEEEHTNWLEAQLDLIEQAGEQNYLAQQIED